MSRRRRGGSTRVCSTGSGSTTARIEAIAAQVAASADLAAARARGRRWTLDNGLGVSERRDPDRRGRRELRGAAERRRRRRRAAPEESERRRPAHGRRGAAHRHGARRRRHPPGTRVGRAAGRARSGSFARADREGARQLVSLPRARAARDPARQRARRRRRSRASPREHGVRTLAHAEGGGVLYVHGSADAEKALRARRGEPRPPRRLQPPQPAARRPAAPSSCQRCSSVLRRAARRAGPSGRPRGREPLDRPLGHEWASDPERVATVTLDVVDGARRGRADRERGDVRPRRGRSSPRTSAAASRFLDAYRGTAAFWHAPTRFTDGFALTGAPETGINVDRFPGPRGPVTYRDLWLRQYRVVGDGTQAASDGRSSSSSGSSLVVDEDGRVRRGAARRAAGRSPPSSAAASRSASSRRARSRSGCRGSGSTGARASMPKLQAASALGQAPLQRAWDDALAPHGSPPAQVLLTAADDRRPARPTSTPGTR